MSEQYFAKKPGCESRPVAFETECVGVRASFETDAGVFSKGELDEGTRVLLEALPPLHGRALDLGCGWGAVGVLLGKKYPDVSLLMADVNESAVALAAKNLARNGVKNARAVESDVYENVDGTFDFIVTNPPIRAGKAVIYSMFDGARDLLSPGGRLYVVIRKQQGAPSALRHMQELYASARVIAREKGFWVIECEGKKEDI